MISKACYDMVKNIKITLIFILVLSFFLRVYNFKSFYVFSHDQDLASWIVKDIVENRHTRLVGQETSSQGVLIGSLFYFLQVPFYLLSSMNPLGAVFLPIILGVFATYSIFYVFSKISNPKIGLIGAFIYSASALIVFIDREVAPTMPVMLWTVWYLYSLFLTFKGEQLKGFILWAFLMGLVWHLNMALIILSPLILVALLFSKKKIEFKSFLLGLVVLFITSLPLMVFEIRHNFSQTKAIYASLTTEKDLEVETSRGFLKLDRVMQLVNKNSIGLFSKNNFVRPSTVFTLLMVVMFYFIKTKKINSFFGTVFILWMGLYVGFFTLNSLNPSEYYFNGMNIVFVFIASLGLSELGRTNYGNKLFYFLVVLFLLNNVSHIFNYNTDKKGYVEKIELIKHIKTDSLMHNYPCISVSYITSPGYELGYRYLFYIEDMHVNKPISKSPVYTIVYPHNLVDRIGSSFGSLGLIYPEYEKYNEKEVIESCKGQNSNLTDPMFGYTD